PALLLLRRKQHQRVARSAFLETAGPLKVLQLAINPHPGRFRQGNRKRAGCLHHVSGNPPRRLLDVLESNRHSSFYYVPTAPCQLAPGYPLAGVKAAEDSRTPKPCGISTGLKSRASVLECGC